MSGAGTGVATVAAPATPAEPLTVAEVIAYLQLDESNQEPPPGVFTVALASPAAPGNVTDGAHRYLATFVTVDGETQAGTASAVVTVADGAVNGQVELTAIPLGGALVTSRKIYRTIAGGSTYLLLTTIANNTTTTYTDNVADGSLGVGAPATNSTDDPMLSSFISAARQGAEKELRRKLVTQSVSTYFDDFPRMRERRFMLEPTQSITSITYLDTDGAEQTLSASNYVVDTQSAHTRIDEAYGTCWPATRGQINAIRITYVAGYGAAADVPACIKTWMKFQIRTMWDTRTQFTISTGRAALTQIPNPYIDGMLDGERVLGRV